MLFKDVIGQGDLKQSLINQVKRGKIPHAQLFNGQSGHGSLPLTIAFIQYLFCLDKKEHDSCGICPSCKKMQELQHPDLHFAFPMVQGISHVSNTHLEPWREIIKDNPYFDLYSWIQKIDPKERKPIISVHESKEIIKTLNLKSFEGGYKVMLIWQAEQMNRDCSNKLLKILEEPQQKTLFILISSSTDTILPTILSRTNVFNVPRIENNDLSSFLCSEFNMSEEEASTSASFSEGNLFISIKNKLDTSSENYFDYFVQLMRVCYKKDVLNMLEWASEIANLSRESHKLFLKYCLHMFRQSLLYNYQEGESLKVAEKEREFLNNFAKFINGNNIELFMNHFNKAYNSLDRTGPANSKILFTQLTFWVMRGIHQS